VSLKALLDSPFVVPPSGGPVPELSLNALLDSPFVVPPSDGPKPGAQPHLIPKALMDVIPIGRDLGLVPGPTPPHFLETTHHYEKGLTNRQNCRHQALSCA
jgi:hypothetical protein